MRKATKDNLTIAAFFAVFLAGGAWLAKKLKPKEG